MCQLVKTVRRVLSLATWICRCCRSPQSFLLANLVGSIHTPRSSIFGFPFGINTASYIEDRLFLPATFWSSSGENVENQELGLY